MNTKTDKVTPYFLDDRVIIPEHIKRMSKEELDREIAKAEKEIKERKEKEKQKQVAV